MKLLADKKRCSNFVSLQETGKFPVDNKQHKDKNDGDWFS